MITVSLETAKKLKEAGFSQNSSCCFEFHRKIGINIEYILAMDNESIPVDANDIAAPTFEEIWKGFPEYDNTKGQLIIEDTVLSIYYPKQTFNEGTESYHSVSLQDSLAESAATLYLKLKSEGHV